MSEAENKENISPGESAKEDCRFVYKLPSIDDFHIIKPISRGSFGKVYLGKKKNKSDKMYAIKIMRKSDMVHKNMVDQVLAERNALAISQSPFVVQLYYSLQSKNNIYLVLEYMIGGDVKSLLHIYGYFDEYMAVFYAAEAALALEYLHNHGIVHRDLKPDNMLITSTGHMKLTDFGLSKVTIKKLDLQDVIGTPSCQMRSHVHPTRTPGQLLSITSSLSFGGDRMTTPKEQRRLLESGTTPEACHMSKNNPKEPIPMNISMVSCVDSPEIRRNEVTPSHFSLLRTTPLSNVSVVNTASVIRRHRNSYCSNSSQFNSFTGKLSSKKESIQKKRSLPRKRVYSEVCCEDRLPSTSAEKGSISEDLKRLTFDSQSFHNKVSFMSPPHKKLSFSKALSVSSSVFMDTSPCPTRLPECPLNSTASPMSVESSHNISIQWSVDSDDVFVNDKEQNFLPKIKHQGNRSGSMFSASTPGMDRTCTVRKMVPSVGSNYTGRTSHLSLSSLHHDHSESVASSFPRCKNVSETTPRSKLQTPFRTPKSVRRGPEPSEDRRILGTPDYLAPELLLQRDHGSPVDWWALGVCIYEFLTGIPPFNDQTPEAVFNNILRRDIPWPGGDEALSSSACITINALLNFDPQTRPGPTELCNLPLFEHVDWDNLLQQEAPFIPNPDDETDTTYFQARNNVQQIRFSGFSDD